MNAGIKEKTGQSPQYKETLYLLLTSLGCTEWQSTSLSTLEPLKDALLTDADQRTVIINHNKNLSAPDLDFGHYGSTPHLLSMRKQTYFNLGLANGRHKQKTQQKRPPFSPSPRFLQDGRVPLQRPCFLLGGPLPQLPLKAQE